MNYLEKLLQQIPDSANWVVVCAKGSILSNTEEMNLRSVFLGLLSQPLAGVGMLRAFSIYQERRSGLFINNHRGHSIHCLTKEHSDAYKILDRIWNPSFPSDRYFISADSMHRSLSTNLQLPLQAKLIYKTLFHNTLLCFMFNSSTIDELLYLLSDGT